MIYIVHNIHCADTAPESIYHKGAAFKIIGGQYSLNFFGLNTTQTDLVGLNVKEFRMSVSRLDFFFTFYDISNSHIIIYIKLSYIFTLILFLWFSSYLYYNYSNSSCHFL